MKLGAWPGFRLPDLDGIAPWVRAAASSDRELAATYYDAADLRLVRAGITIRHRTGEGGATGRWTAKVPVPGSAARSAPRSPSTPVPRRCRPAVLAVLRGVLRHGHAWRRSPAS